MYSASRPGDRRARRSFAAKSLRNSAARDFHEALRDNLGHRTCMVGSARSPSSLSKTRARPEPGRAEHLQQFLELKFIDQVRVLGGVNSFISSKNVPLLDVAPRLLAARFFNAPAADALAPQQIAPETVDPRKNAFDVDRHALADENLDRPPLALERQHAVRVAQQLATPPSDDN
jgi:hypothetical protein